MVKIHTDAATLAGLIGHVPTSDGYGVIDPALARELAADATWQGLYREADQIAGAVTGSQGALLRQRGYCHPTDTADSPNRHQAR